MDNYKTKVINDKKVYVRKILVGKVNFNHPESSRKLNKVIVELRLTSDNCFSACIDVWNMHESDIYMGGQAFDDVKTMFPEIANMSVFQEIYDLWVHYHLNDMTPGTPRQMEYLKNLGIRDYCDACKTLKEASLYEDRLPDGTMYRYGSGWLKTEIPETDLARIRTLIFSTECMEE